MEDHELPWSKHVIDYVLSLEQGEEENHLFARRQFAGRPNTLLLGLSNLVAAIGGEFPEESFESLSQETRDAFDLVNAVEARDIEGANAIGARYRTSDDAFERLLSSMASLAFTFAERRAREEGESALDHLQRLRRSTFYYS